MTAEIPTPQFREEKNPWMEYLDMSFYRINVDLVCWAGFLRETK